MAEQNSLSAVLKRYRVAAGFSQEALAAHAGLSVRAISDLERGLHRAPHASTIDLLATAMSLSPNQRAILLAASRPNLTDSADRAGNEPHARNLPTALTSIIGRKLECNSAQVLLHEGCRLLTFTGPSGVGKTRLALEVAQSLMASFNDGVVFVDLAPIRDVSLFLGAIAEAHGLRERGNISPADLVYVYLREKHMLLVLDNFEHMLEAAPLVAEILSHSPHLSILVTSRAPLRLRGERQLTLSPLPLNEAATLFCERAGAIRPSQEIPQAIAEAICERVDRIPLAIELAAVQTRILPPQQLLEHLQHRLLLLRGGARDLPQRQQTMEDAIAWSYERLDDAQQACFRALSVFVGGWTLEAAQAITADGPGDAPIDTLLALAALVDASLIQAEAAPNGSVRFHMLELMREYALARLTDTGEEQARRRRHAEYFADMADLIMHFGPGKSPQFADPSPELPNARAALEWAERQGEAALGLRLGGFGRLWHVRGQMREAKVWQERMLALDDRLRAQGQRTVPLNLRAERLIGLARTLLGAGEYERAETLCADALRLAQRIGDEDTICNAYMTQGMIAQARGDYGEAVTALTAANRHASPTETARLRYRVEALLAQAECKTGAVAHAIALLESAVAGAEAVDNTWDTARITAMLALLMSHEQRYPEATRYFTKALALFRPFDSPGFSAWCLEGFAAVLSAEERHEQAIRLCAAAAAQRERAQMPAPSPEREATDAIIASARDKLSASVFADVWRAGAALSGAAAITEALTEGARRVSAEETIGEVSDSAV